MTPEERAQVLVSDWSIDQGVIYARAVLAISAAIIEEREACAKVADGRGDEAEAIAEEIRGRA